MAQQRQRRVGDVERRRRDLVVRQQQNLDESPAFYRRPGLFIQSHTARVDWLGLRVGGHLALSLHSSDEPCELSQ